MAHTMKPLLKITFRRLRKKLLPQIPGCQYGFMPDKGTRNAIFVLRSLCERSVEHQSGADPRGRIAPPKTCESNFIHHDFEQFGK